MQEPANRFGLRGLKRPAIDADDPFWSGADGGHWQPMPRPPEPRDSLGTDDEERALRAEKMALAHHRTSLLGGVDWRRLSPRRREESEGPAGVFIFQIIAVVILAGGLAFVIDPAIVPPEWFAFARRFASGLAGGE